MRIETHLQHVKHPYIRIENQSLIIPMAVFSNTPASRKCFLLAAAFLLLHLLSFSQGSPLDTPSAPLIRLIDDHYRHTIGTGFLLELDLSALPYSFRKVTHLQPVRTVEPEYADKPGQPHLPGHARNPLLGLFAGLARIGDFAQRPTLLPLPSQPVYPLDSGVTLDSAGTLFVQTRPANGRLRLFIPQYFMRDSAAFYLILHEDRLQTSSFRYVQSPMLVVDRAIPDVAIQLLTTQRGRYLGAEGQWVRFAYQPPRYLTLDSLGPFMRPKILLNGKYAVPFPDPNLPTAWSRVDAEPGELTCFVPDAASGEDGKIMLNLSLELNEFARIISIQGISLDSPPRSPCGTLRVQVTSIIQSVRPRRWHPTPGRFFVFFTAGGTRMGSSGMCNPQRSSTSLLVWDDYPPITLSACATDSIGILISGKESEYFTGTRYTLVLLPTEKLQGTHGNYVVKRNVKRLHSRYKWKINVTYWRE